MSAHTERPEKPSLDRGRAEFFTFALAAGLTYIISGWDLLSGPEAVLVSWSIALAIGYWLSPIPHESYARWMLEQLVLLTAFYLAVWKVPVWLKQWMSSLLAYGISNSTFLALYALALIGPWRASPNRI